jgi:hypothetical protein
LKKVAEIQVPNGAIMYRLDMKHFFMSGTPPDLCDSAVAVLPRGRRRDLLSKVLLWLLDSQWISSKMHSGRCYKVMRGSGMGLTHSSAVCDAALFFFWLNPRGPRGSRFSRLTLYMRIIAIWILASDRGLARRFISRFRDLAAKVLKANW